MTFTYIVRRRADGLTKIGKSANPKGRLQAFGPLANFEPIALIDGDCELELHARFSRFRVHGEWFDLSESTIQGLSDPDSVAKCYLPRPKVSRKKPMCHTLHIRIPQALLLELEAIADNEECAISDLGREALEALVASRTATATR